MYGSWTETAVLLRHFLGFISDLSDVFRIHLRPIRRFHDSFETYQTFLGFIWDLSDVFRIHFRPIRRF